MDPIRTLLTTLQQWLPGDADTRANMQQQLERLFERYALVPRHEYEAHLEILTTLRHQVAELEQRLADLESVDAPPPPAE